MVDALNQQDMTKDTVDAFVPEKLRRIKTTVQRVSNYTFLPLNFIIFFQLQSWSLFF